MLITVIADAILTQQRQYGLRNLVSLRQYRSTSLLQDLRAAHVGNFGSVVGVFDTAFRSGQVVNSAVQVVNSRFEAVSGSHPGLNAGSQRQR